MQFLLFCPRFASPEDARSLASLLDRVDVAALVLLRDDAEAEDAYAARIRPLIETVQSRDCAALLDGLPSLVKPLGADGVHMTSGQRGFTDAIATLKPDYIVGAGDVHSHHEAMLRGEAGADYLLFGDPRSAPSAADIADAEWWAETFEIDDAIVADPEDPEPAMATGAEFVAFGPALWELPDPDRLLVALHKKASK